ncbi:MAG: peptidoglycan-binding domain-containing protein [Oceanobacter sp.]
MRRIGLEMCGAEIDEEPAEIDFDITKLGSRGKWVTELQEALGVGADGIFGKGTEAALIAFQKSEGLEADGIAGRGTYRALGLLP